MAVFFCIYFLQFFRHDIGHLYFTDQMVVHDRKKYEAYENMTNEYTFHLTLQLKKLKKRDYGAYKCISKNSIGESEGVIRIYGKRELFITEWVYS